MITVIKHGKETFTVTCPVCGCVFTYHAEDLNEDCFQNHYVICPDCQHHVSHDEPKKKSLHEGILWEVAEEEMKKNRDYPYPVTLKASEYTWPDCETCPNKPDPTKVIVGDTPCTWCKKNMPYCNAVDVQPKCLTSPEDIDLPQ